MPDEVPALPSEKSTEPTFIEKAAQTAERLEKANAEHRALLERAEKLQMDATMGGKSYGGMPAKSENQLKKEELMKPWKSNELNPYKGQGARALQDLD